MSAPQEERRVGWTIQEAERLLLSLTGVLSARVVARPGGDVEEIHLLTSHEVKPKQTVRNVESALRSYLDLHVDHRKISVAQTDERRFPRGPEPELVPLAAPVVQLVAEPEPTLAESRLLFFGHRMETERYNQVRHRVEIEWNGGQYAGDALAADVPRAKLEAVAQATLAAVQTAAEANQEEGGRAMTLSLDGVKVVEAFDRDYVLVAVHAISGRNVTPLAGSTLVERSPERAAIMATLQATDRWVRGQF